MKRKFYMLDLFSGIGGFALAAKSVWKDDLEICSFVEIDQFCQQVLRKHWPLVPIHTDIKDYKHNGTKINLLTGGFPCQPFSVAGRKKGVEDNHYLWPEMFRIIKETKPYWVIGENVTGIVKLALEQVCVDLESEGYEVQPFIIPAAAVNAPHQRKRVWIVANYNHVYGNDAGSGSGTLQCKEQTKVLGVSTDSYSQKSGLERGDSKRTGSTDGCYSESVNGCIRYYQEKSWNESWIEVASRLCRVDARIPNRVDRLKALGNSIVPQVVIPIMQAIKNLEG